MLTPISRLSTPKTCPAFVLGWMTTVAFSLSAATMSSANMVPTPLISSPLTCTATDGDTIRCGPPAGSTKPERIRLLGIDAPELPGHCRKTRVCVLGDPWKAKANIVVLLRRSPITILRVGTDRYGRTLALVAAGGVDLSCAQWKAGLASYIPKWDNGARLRTSCR